jgi:hypothetical protein
LCFLLRERQSDGVLEAAKSRTGEVVTSQMETSQCGTREMVTGKAEAAEGCCLASGWSDINH